MAADERALHDHDPVASAAPELLAALKECLSHFSYCAERAADRSDKFFVTTPGSEYRRLINMCNRALSCEEPGALETNDPARAECRT